MEHARVGGGQIAYRRAGSGPPLLLLHGYVGGSADWELQLRELADELTVVAWDAPGFGGSSDPPADLDLAGFADAVAGLVDAAGLEQPHLLGLSFGGGLALEVYRRHPQLPRSLTLVSAYAGWRGSLPADEVERRLEQALRLADLPPEQLVSELLPTLFRPGAPPDVVASFATRLLHFRPAGLRATARAFAQADLRDVLPRIEVPTLLLYGEEDVRAPPAVARSIQAAIPGSRLVLLPGVGHIVHLEAPQRFNAEVRAFLRSVSA